MPDVTKPLASVAKERTQRAPDRKLEGVLHRHEIASIIEKIAPKSDGPKPSRRAKEILHYLLGGRKKVTKVTFA